MDKLATGASLPEIEELIQRDVQLAVRVIKVAGAPAFGGRKIQSLRHAVEMLGFDQLRSVVTAATYLGSDKRMIVPGLSAERFQRRSLLLALLSRTLACRLGLVDEESHFMAGLLQDCGYLPIGKLVPERLQQIIAVLARTPVDDITELEQYYLGFTHTDAGRILTEEYNLCEGVQQAVAYHHCPMFASEAGQAYADLAHLASWMADQLGLVVIDQVQPHKLDKYAAKRLGIEPGGLLNTLGSIRQTANQSYEVICR